MRRLFGIFRDRSKKEIETAFGSARSTKDGREVQNRVIGLLTHRDGHLVSTRLAAAIGSIHDAIPELIVEAVHPLPIFSFVKGECELAEVVRHCKANVSKCDGRFVLVEGEVEFGLIETGTNIMDYGSVGAVISIGLEAAQILPREKSWLGVTLMQEAGMQAGAEATVRGERFASLAS